jgi:hypothetical protein
MASRFFNKLKSGAQRFFGKVASDAPRILGKISNTAGDVGTILRKVENTGKDILGNPLIEAGASMVLGPEAGALSPFAWTKRGGRLGWCGAHP